MSDQRTEPDPEFAELIRAREIGLINDSKARDILKRLRPHWFEDKPRA